MTGTETDFDIAKALAIGQLSKPQAQELIPAGKGLNFVSALLPLDALSKFVDGQKFEELGEDGFP